MGMERVQKYLFEGLKLGKGSGWFPAVRPGSGEMVAAAAGSAPPDVVMDALGMRRRFYVCAEAQHASKASTHTCALTVPNW